MGPNDHATLHTLYETQDSPGSMLNPHHAKKLQVGQATLLCTTSMRHGTVHMLNPHNAKFAIVKRGID